MYLSLTFSSRFGISGSLMGTAATPSFLCFSCTPPFLKNRRISGVLALGFMSIGMFTRSTTVTKQEGMVCLLTVEWSGCVLWDGWNQSLLFLILIAWIQTEVEIDYGLTNIRQLFLRRLPTRTPYKVGRNRVFPSLEVNRVVCSRAILFSSFESWKRCKMSKSLTDLLTKLGEVYWNTHLFPFSAFFFPWMNPKDFSFHFQ